MKGIRNFVLEHNRLKGFDFGLSSNKEMILTLNKLHEKWIEDNFTIFTKAF